MMRILDAESCEALRGVRQWVIARRSSRSLSMMVSMSVGDRVKIFFDPSSILLGQ
jgi:hypothetical protein